MAPPPQVSQRHLLHSSTLPKGGESARETGHNSVSGESDKHRPSSPGRPLEPHFLGHYYDPRQLLQVKTWPLYSYFFWITESGISASCSTF